MAESMADLIADLEKQKGIETPIYRDLKETGLSWEAERVLDKLRGANVADGYHRVYQQTPTEMAFVDALTDSEIAGRGYTPTNDDPPVRTRGDSPAARDVIRRHTTEKAAYAADVWIGETLT